MNVTLKLAIAISASLAAAGTAQAIPISGPNGSGTVVATSANGATSSPFPLAFFGSSSANGLVSTAPVAFSGATVTFSPDTANPMAGVYAGSVGGVSLTAFSGTSLPGAATNEYLVAQPSDPVTVSYTTARNVFNLLWGSVDTYNSLDLQFFSGATLVSDLLVTGGSVLTAEGGGAAGGSAFVTITDNSPFSSVVLSSTGNAFEFVPDVSVPEPVSIALFGTGLLGMGLVVSRRRGGAL